MLNRRPSVAVLALLTSLPVACVDRPHPPPAPRRTTTEPTAPASPSMIGFNASDVPQVRLAMRTTPARAVLGPRPIESVASATLIPGGGAMVAWASWDRRDNIPVTRMQFRTFDANGTASMVWQLRDMRGTVRSIGVSYGREDALIAWNAEYGGFASNIGAQRVLRDGSVRGQPINIGTFRVAQQADAALLDDAFGFPLRVLASNDRYLLALRGPLVTCAEGGGACETFRVAELDDTNLPHGRSGLEERNLATPIALLAAEGREYNGVVSQLNTDGSSSVRVLGNGPLSRIGSVPGAMQVAFVDAVGPSMIVRRGPNGAPAANNAPIELLTARGGDGGVAPAQRVQSANVRCANGVAVTELRLVGTASTSRVVPVTASGGSDLLRWALARNDAAPAPATATAPATQTGVPTAPAAPLPTPIAVAWTGQGVVIAREGRLEFARCSGDTLAPATEVP